MRADLLIIDGHVSVALVVKGHVPNPAATIRLRHNAVKDAFFGVVR